MYYKTEIRIEPKEGRNLPDAVTVGSDMFDVLAGHLNKDAACDFTVVTMSVSQQPEGEDEFRSVPEPVRCEAVIHTGPGHQSRHRCTRTDPHPADGDHWITEVVCEWTGPKAYSREI